MSAIIYGAPEWVKVPNIWELPDDVDYQELEVKYKADIADILIKGNLPRNKYIGKIIKFPVADGYAEYMVKNMKPLHLVHLPIMDCYESANVDLMTAERVIELIESNERFESFLERNRKNKEI
jgi:hypothetical protein